MCRSFNFELKPQGHKGLELEVYSYKAAPDIPREMTETVYLGVNSAVVRACVDLTPSEARALASYLVGAARAADGRILLNERLDAAAAATTARSALQSLADAGSSA